MTTKLGFSILGLITIMLALAPLTAQDDTILNLEPCMDMDFKSMLKDYNFNSSLTPQDLYIAGTIMRDLSLICGYTGGVSATDEESNLQGHLLYNTYCEQCHGHDGYGEYELAPAIRNPLLFGIEPIISETKRIQEIDTYLNEELRPEKHALIKYLSVKC